MEIKINYVKNVVIGVPEEITMLSGSKFYSRELMVKTQDGYEKIILNSYEEKIISFEDEKKEKTKEDKKK